MATYDGLLAFTKAGGSRGLQRRPDLAEKMPTLTNGGKTWTFKIRKGVKFSNGKEVTTDDVVASLRRIFKVKSPTSGGFYAGIVGADACLKKRGHVHAQGRRQREPSARTVTINLKAADPEFKYKLAVPHARSSPRTALRRMRGRSPFRAPGRTTSPRTTRTSNSS